MPDNNGKLSPLTSSSSQHEEASDNHTEYYVKYAKEEVGYVVSSTGSELCSNCKFFDGANKACSVVAGNIEPNDYCKLYIEGGEKMTEKGLDVEESVTTDESYAIGTNTTEPDPESELAMQKAATYTRPAEQAGEGTYGTTANSTVDAPDSGATTEPSSVHKASCCDDCGTECDGNCCQKCSKMMNKAAGCSCTCDNCQKCMGMNKAAEDDEKDEPAPDVEELEKTVPVEIKKSEWNGAFAPITPFAAMRTVFTQD